MSGGGLRLKVLEAPSFPQDLLGEALLREQLLFAQPAGAAALRCRFCSAPAGTTQGLGPLMPIRANPEVATRMACT